MVVSKLHVKNEKLYAYGTVDPSQMNIRMKGGGAWLKPRAPLTILVMGSALLQFTAACGSGSARLTHPSVHPSLATWSSACCIPVGLLSCTDGTWDSTEILWLSVVGNPCNPCLWCCRGHSLSLQQAHPACGRCGIKASSLVPESYQNISNISSLCVMPLRRAMSMPSGWNTTRGFTGLLLCFW